MTHNSEPSQFLMRLMANHKRVAIVGPPKSGKTALTDFIRDRKVIHTDDFMHLDWSDASKEVVEACKEHERFVVEGVAVPRALRKGLKVDAILWLQGSYRPLSKGQQTMAKGIKTVMMDYLVGHEKPSQIVTMVVAEHC